MKGLLLYTILFGLIMLTRPVMLLDNTGRFKSVKHLMQAYNTQPMAEVIRTLPAIAILIAIFVAFGGY